MNSYAVLALVALGQANPLIVARQAVTGDISPTAVGPPGCSPYMDYRFGIAVQNVSTSAIAKRQTTQAVQPAQQIADGQVQVIPSGIALPPSLTNANIATSPTSVTVALVSQISDGQVQADVVNTVLQNVGGKLQRPTPTTTITTVAAVAAVSEATDGQPIATSEAAPDSTGIDSCLGLTIVLDNGKITDQSNRTGYIASNFQLQFDRPPQAGALYTSGFSVCNNGSLGLGGSNIFFQCLSGSFYNLYDRSWAAQCSAVTIEIYRKNCSAA